MFYLPTVGTVGYKYIAPAGACVDGAPKGRKNVAHGVSRGSKGRIQTSPEGAQECSPRREPWDRM